MAGISDKALKTNYAENKYRFVGQLYEDDFALDTYQFKYRNHDPQIGRFSEVDPLATKYVYNSPYAYAESNPTSGIDLEGKELLRAIEQFIAGNPQAGTSSLAEWYLNKSAQYNNTMQAANRVANNTSGKTSGYGPIGVQNAIATINKLNDQAALAQPALDQLAMVVTAAQLTPVGEAGGAAATVGRSVMELAGGLDAQVPLNDAGQQIQSTLLGNTSLSSSFSNGAYNMVEAQQDMVVPRIFGGSSEKEGSFLGLTAPTSTAEAEGMYNLKAFDNNASQMTTVTIKKGTQFAIGPVAGGTGTQIFLPTYLQGSNVIYSSTIVPLK